MITKVGHHCIVVRDLEKSLTFYRDVLGLKLLFIANMEWDEETSRAMLGVKRVNLKIAQLQVGDDVIELIHYVDPEGKPCDVPCEPYNFGNTHISFNVKDLHTTYEKLKKKGIKFYFPPQKIKEEQFKEKEVGRRFKGVMWCYLCDPDGAWLELHE